MESAPLAEAKATLSKLVQRARDGEPTQITLRGRPVAQIAGLDAPKRSIDVDELRRLTDSMPECPEPPEGFVRWMRDSDRY